MAEARVDRQWRDLRRMLDGLPQAPTSRSHPRLWLHRAKRSADFLGHMRFDTARFFAAIDPYPKPFRHVWLRGDDEVRIAGWLGPHRMTQPADWGLVMVPGMFSTKDDTVHKRRAIRIWRHWRIPVLALDLRSFGESRGISTAGWKEADDILVAARYMRRECNVDRVGVIAESLGGAAALNAAGFDAERGTGLLDGGILTWAAFVDTRDAVEYISARPPPDHPFAIQWQGFRRLLWLKSMGGYERFSEYMEDAARVNGLASAQELYAQANPKARVRHIQTPTLAIHALDDPVVPIRHARRLQRYADGNPLVEVLMTHWGGHTSFEALDPDWYWEVTRRWFGAVHDRELPVPTRKGARAARA